MIESQLFPKMTVVRRMCLRFIFIYSSSQNHIARLSKLWCLLYIISDFSFCAIIMHYNHSVLFMSFWSLLSIMAFSFQLFKVIWFLIETIPKYQGINKGKWIIFISLLWTEQNYCISDDFLLLVGYLVCCFQWVRFHINNHARH